MARAVRVVSPLLARFVVDLASGKIEPTADVGDFVAPTLLFAESGYELLDPHITGFVRFKRAFEGAGQALGHLIAEVADFAITDLLRFQAHMRPRSIFDLPE